MSRRGDFTGSGPIIFEGRELPNSAKGFNQLPFWNELPCDVQDWLRDLFYSWGRTRQLSSRRVLSHVTLVRSKLDSSRPAAIQSLQKAFPDATEADAAKSVEGWFEALKIIEGAAKQTRICRWTVPAQDACIEQNIKLAIAIYRQTDLGLPLGFEFHIRNCPRDKQLEWLAGISDSINEPRTGWGEWLRRLKNFVTRSDR